MRGSWSMPIRRILIAAVVLIVLAGPLVGLPPRAWGSDTDGDRQSLARLTGVYVLVEGLPAAARGLLAVDPLQTAVELAASAGRYSGTDEGGVVSGGWQSVLVSKRQRPA